MITASSGGGVVKPIAPSGVGVVKLTESFAWSALIVDRSAARCDSMSSAGIESQQVLVYCVKSNAQTTQSKL